MPRPRMNRVLTLQPLENRSLMAGDVVATLTPSTGILNITGDAANNSIEIRQLDNGALRVSGKYWSGAATKIGGIGFRDYQQVQGIQIDMGAGNDQVTIGTTGKVIQLSKDLNVNLGSGADRLNIVSLIASQDALLELGSGNDELYLERIAVKDDLTIKAGKGFDTVQADIAIVGFGESDQNQNDFMLDMQGGGGSVGLNNVHVRRNLFVSDDWLGNNGLSNVSNQFSISNSYVDGYLGIGGGNASDTIELTQVQVEKAITILAKNGADSVRLKNVDSGTMIAVDLGGGNDLLRTENVSAVDQLFATGGSGNDELQTVGGLFVGSFDTFDFEVS